MAMTLQQFLANTGAQPIYNEAGQVSGLNANKDANYWKNFAQLLGYQGNDTGKFLLGMVNADGSPVAAGNYRGTPSGWETAQGVQQFVQDERFGGYGGLTDDIKNAEAAAGKHFLNTPTSQGGVAPNDYFGGQIKNSGNEFGDFLSQPAVLASLAAAGGSALMGAGGAGAAGTAAAAPAATGGASAGTLSMFGGAAPMFGAEAALGGSGLGAATGGAGLGAAGLGTAAGGIGALGSIGSAASGLGGSGGGGSSNETFGIPNNILGGAVQGIGGLLAADKSGDAYKDVANQYLALGAPSRSRFEGSFAPGFDLTQQDPGFQGALDTAANTSARALSTKYGNPADSPTAQAEMQKYLAGSLYLPQLNTYRSQNLTGGGLGVNTAGTASGAAAGSAGSGWEAVGAGLGTALNPQPNIFQQLGLGGTKSGSLTAGGMPVK